MADPPTSRRRFQFSLRSLMIVVGIIAALCAYFSHERQVVQERQKLIESLPRLPGKVFNDDPRFMTRSPHFVAGWAIANTTPSRWATAPPTPRLITSRDYFPKQRSSGTQRQGIRTLRAENELDDGAMIYLRRGQRRYNTTKRLPRACPSPNRYSIRLHTRMGHYDSTKSATP